MSEHDTLPAAEPVLPPPPIRIAVPSDGEQEFPGEVEMTLVGHLEELRAVEPGDWPEPMTPVARRMQVILEAELRARGQ